MGDAEVSSSFSKKPKNENDKDVDRTSDGTPTTRIAVDDAQLNIESNSNSGDPSNHKAVSSKEEITESATSTEKKVEEDQVEEHAEKPKEEEKAEEVELKVIFNKEPLPIRIALNKTVGKLKVEDFKKISVY